MFPIYQFLWIPTELRSGVTTKKTWNMINKIFLGHSLGVEKTMGDLDAIF